MPHGFVGQQRTKSVVPSITRPTVDPVTGKIKPGRVINDPQRGAAKAKRATTASTKRVERTAGMQRAIDPGTPAMTTGKVVWQTKNKRWSIVYHVKTRKYDHVNGCYLPGQWDHNCYDIICGDVRDHGRHKKWRALPNGTVVTNSVIPASVLEALRLLIIGKQGA